MSSMDPEPLDISEKGRPSDDQIRTSDRRLFIQLLANGVVGRSFGRAGYDYDIRLACHGLDKNDNDFVIGLIGPGLQPLSAIVQRMRKIKQTSQYLERLGPFFVGKAVWHSETNYHDE